ACETRHRGRVLSTDRRHFCSRTPAARSREASMSASDNLSTKCSGLLLRSSFAILAARRRHLISVAPMPAFSFASRLSNSSDIILKDMCLLPSLVPSRRERSPGEEALFSHGAFSQNVTWLTLGT